MAKPLGFKDFINVDYTQSGDDQLAYNAKKRKKADQEHEALSITQRLKRSRQMKKYKSRLKIGREKAKRRTAGKEVLRKRAKKDVRNKLFLKFSKGVKKGDMAPQRRGEIEKRIDKLPKSRIDMLVRKAIPQMRKKEMLRKRGAAPAAEK
jgi:hypothetical protein